MKVFTVALFCICMHKSNNAKQIITNIFFNFFVTQVQLLNYGLEILSCGRSRFAKKCLCSSKLVKNLLTGHVNLESNY